MPFIINYLPPHKNLTKFFAFLNLVHHDVGVGGWGMWRGRVPVICLYCKTKPVTDLKAGWLGLHFICGRCTLNHVLALKIIFFLKDFDLIYLCSSNHELSQFYLVWFAEYILHFSVEFLTPTLFNIHDVRILCKCGPKLQMAWKWECLNI